MEQKQTDIHIKAMLNSPARFTPAVPTPDWSITSPATTSVTAVVSFKFWCIEQIDLKQLIF